MHQLTQILLAHYIVVFVVITGSLNPAVANQTAPPERLGMCHSELQPDVKQTQGERGILVNSPPEVYIISDRQESVAEFFKRRRLVVGTVMSQVLDITLTTPQVVQGNCFVAYPSANDDGRGEITTYGLIFKLAPVSLEVVQLWKERHQSNAISVQMFLERDDQDLELYHFVGWTESKQFFLSPELARSNPSPALFNPKDLWYQG